MPLFPNSIDKNFKKKYGNIMYPDFLYKKKYTSFFKKHNLLDFLSIFESFHDEENLVNFVNYFNKSKKIPDLSYLYDFDQDLVQLLNRGIPLSLAQKLKYSSLISYIDILKNNFSMEFIEENMFSITSFFQNNSSIEFLNRKDITKEQKEFLVLHSDYLFHDLAYFDVDFICKYNEFLTYFRNFTKSSYFEKMKESFLVTEDKNLFFKNIFSIVKKFQQQSTNVIMNAYLENPNCFSYLSELPPALDLFPEFIDSLVQRKDIPFFRKLLFDYVKEYNHTENFLSTKMSIPVDKIIDLYRFGSTDSDFVQKYSPFIELLNQLKEVEESKKVDVLEQIIDYMGDKQEFFNKFYEGTVINNFRKNILNVHDEKSLEQFPHSKIMYNNKEIDVITIDDYPFTLLVSGLESKRDSEHFGTSSISQQIVSNPSLWMDMNAVGSDKISMSRINEAYFTSWGSSKNGVICGFSDIRKNQIVSYASSDAATSMEAKEASVSRDLDKSVVDLPKFDQRNCPCFSLDVSLYEEIRANRYLENEDGSFSKYPPDYIVEKNSDGFKQATLEWAHMYGNKIIRFDYEKIAFKAQKEFLECLSQLNEGSLQFSFHVQQRINYLFHIIHNFSSNDDLMKMKNQYFIFLKNYALTTNEDITYVFHGNMEDFRFQEIYQIWQERLQNKDLTHSTEGLGI